MHFPSKICQSIQRFRLGIDRFAWEAYHKIEAHNKTNARTHLAFARCVLFFASKNKVKFEKAGFGRWTLCRFAI